MTKSFVPASTKLKKFVLRIDLRQVGGVGNEERTNNCLRKVNEKLTEAGLEWRRNNATQDARGITLKFKFAKFLEGFAIYEAREEQAK